MCTGHAVGYRIGERDLPNGQGRREDARQDVRIDIGRDDLFGPALDDEEPVRRVLGSKHCRQRVLVAVDVHGRAPVGDEHRVGRQTRRGDRQVLGGADVHLVDARFINHERHAGGIDVPDHVGAVGELVHHSARHRDHDLHGDVKCRPRLPAEREQVTGLEHTAGPGPRRGDEQVDLAAAMGQDRTTRTEPAGGPLIGRTDPISLLVARDEDAVLEVAARNQDRKGRIGREVLLLGGAQDRAAEHQLDVAFLISVEFVMDRIPVLPFDGNAHQRSIARQTDLAVVRVSAVPTVVLRLPGRGGMENRHVGSNAARIPVGPGGHVVGPIMGTPSLFPVRHQHPLVVEGNAAAAGAFLVGNQVRCDAFDDISRHVHCDGRAQWSDVGEPHDVAGEERIHAATLTVAADWRTLRVEGSEEVPDTRDLTGVEI